MSDYGKLPKVPDINNGNGNDLPEKICLLLRANQRENQAA
jgi:hypothetical protein